ncbi:conserved hypothetical protein [Candidatus Brocadia pituitae]|nr:conserved hypothetical protein [Candidatus Brocadia pituitae]
MQVWIHTGKIDKYYSKILHKAFDARQESAYKEFVELSTKDAAEAVKLAREFVECIKEIIRI